MNVGRYYLDLFSGIGGFALGAKWAGVDFDGHYFSEIDAYAIEVYKKRFPEAEGLGDVCYVDYGKLPRGEWFVTGGFPCQPHSDAGKKQGAEDERDLWPECRRMLCELRPRIAVFENVRGLFTSPGRDRRGEFFNGVLSDIHRSGYDAEWQTISAAEVGAPHIRKRVWIICYPNNAGGGGDHYWRTPDANMERGKRSYENMKMRIDEGKPLNLNDQLNAIGKGLLPAPMVGTPTRAMCRRSSKFAEGRIPNPVEYAQMFPTPRNNTGPSTDDKHLSLDGAVRLWPTPRAGNPGSRPNKKGGRVLEEEVKKSLFPTPTAQDFKHRGPNSNQQGLADVVRVWPTPTAFDWNTSVKSRIEEDSDTYKHNLKEAVQRWPTPMACDGDKNSRSKKEHLPGAVWATPTANDAKNTLSESQRGRGTLTAHLVEAGEGGQLNADWTEILMGYPMYWTDIEVENEDCVLMNFPAAWIDGSWEEGIPRIVTGQKNRIKRLKGIGNAVVPIIPMLIWLLIKDYFSTNEVHE